MPERLYRSQHSARLALLVLTPLLLAATCGPSPKPLPAIEGAAPFDPPSSFAAIWYEAEECTGRRGDFRTIKWFIAPTIKWAGFKCGDPLGCNGQYTRATNTIVLADHRMATHVTIKHEMLHALGLSHYDKEFWRCLGKPMPEMYQFP